MPKVIQIQVFIWSERISENQNIHRYPVRPDKNLNLNFFNKYFCQVIRMSEHPQISFQSKYWTLNLLNKLFLPKYLNIKMSKYPLKFFLQNYLSVICKTKKIISFTKNGIIKVVGLDFNNRYGCHLSFFCGQFEQWQWQWAHFWQKNLHRLFWHCWLY